MVHWCTREFVELPQPKCITVISSTWHDINTVKGRHGKRMNLVKGEPPIHNYSVATNLAPDNLQLHTNTWYMEKWPLPFPSYLLGFSHISFLLHGIEISPQLDDFISEFSSIHLARHRIGHCRHLWGSSGSLFPGWRSEVRMSPGSMQATSPSGIRHTRCLHKKDPCHEEDHIGILHHELNWINYYELQNSMHSSVA